MVNQVERALLVRIRVLLAIVIAGLVISGVTAFPLETELVWLTKVLGPDDAASSREPGGILSWLVRVRDALVDTNSRYPFMAYGTDWLAFGHLVIAVMFVGPLVDPRRNVWVMHAGLIGCVGVILVAMIAGPMRGIPFYWRLIDCSFGVLCAIPLLFALRYTRQLERAAVDPVVT